MDAAVTGYVEAIAAEHRPLFDRIHGLAVRAYPDAELVLSYGMPTYRRGKRRLYLAAWKHGISVYGWQQGHEAGFVERHPGLKHSKGTIRIRPRDAVDVTDDELMGLVRAALGDA